MDSGEKVHPERNNQSEPAPVVRREFGSHVSPIPLSQELINHATPYLSAWSPEVAGRIAELPHQPQVLGIDGLYPLSLSKSKPSVDEIARMWVLVPRPRDEPVPYSGGRFAIVAGDVPNFSSIPQRSGEDSRLELYDKLRPLDQSEGVQSFIASNIDAVGLMGFSALVLIGLEAAKKIDRREFLTLTAMSFAGLFLLAARHFALKNVSGALTIQDQDSAKVLANLIGPKIQLNDMKWWYAGRSALVNRKTKNVVEKIRSGQLKFIGLDRQDNVDGLTLMGDAHLFDIPNSTDEEETEAITSLGRNVLDTVRSLLKNSSPEKLAVAERTIKIAIARGEVYSFQEFPREKKPKRYNEILDPGLKLASPFSDETIVNLMKPL